MTIYNDPNENDNDKKLEIQDNGSVKCFEGSQGDKRTVIHINEFTGVNDTNNDECDSVRKDVSEDNATTSI